MTQPVDPAGRPGADVPPYGQEAPYGPPPGASTAGDTGAGAPAGAGAPDAGAGTGGASGGAYAAPGGAYAAPGGAYAAPAAPSAAAGEQAGAAQDAQDAHAGTPYAGTSYAGTPYAGTSYAGTPYAGPGYWPRNDLGIWSLVLGIAGIVLACGFFTGIPAVVVGTNARKAIARGEANNDGVVTAGIVLGWLSIAFGLLMLVVLVLSFLIPLVVLGITLPWAAATSPGY
ncbi:DUF4190 domain-containing protein [Cellulomonas sp. 179-A 9B4 NHS]|uniref:DUF4190 domain-containing protein n=1 Tax=Cellulomonas sp. 179-A 9B4 NHS TaxID=3142379 RepID=UPI0039A2EDA2